MISEEDVIIFTIVIEISGFGMIESGNLVLVWHIHVHVITIIEYCHVWEILVNVEVLYLEDLNVLIQFGKKETTTLKNTNLL